MSERDPYRPELQDRYEAALRLVWSIHVRKHVHLGLERASGLEGRCIPCICALALGMSIDGSATAAQFDEQRAKLLAEDDTHTSPSQGTEK